MPVVGLIPIEPIPFDVGLIVFHRTIQRAACVKPNGLAPSQTFASDRSDTHVVIAITGSIVPGDLNLFARAGPGGGG